MDEDLSYSALFLPELCTVWIEDVTGPFYHKPLKFKPITMPIFFLLFPHGLSLNCMVAGRCSCYLIGNSWPQWKGGGLGEHLWSLGLVLPLTCGSRLLPLHLMRTCVVKLAYLICLCLFSAGHQKTWLWAPRCSWTPASRWAAVAAVSRPVLGAIQFLSRASLTS